MKVRFSIDGGRTFQEAPQGLRVLIWPVDLPDKPTRGDMSFNFTDEGIVTDLLEHTEAGKIENIGTDSAMYDEIIEYMLEDNISQ